MLVSDHTPIYSFGDGAFAPEDGARSFYPWTPFFFCLSSFPLHPPPRPVRYAMKSFRRLELLNSYGEAGFFAERNSFAPALLFGSSWVSFGEILPEESFKRPLSLCASFLVSLPADPLPYSRLPFRGNLFSSWKDLSGVLGMGGIALGVGQAICFLAVFLCGPPSLVFRPFFRGRRLSSRRNLLRLSFLFPSRWQSL